MSHVHLRVPRKFSLDLKSKQFSFDLNAGEKWITLHPNGRRETGVPVLVTGTKGNYTIKGGAGGKFTGQKVGEITKAGKAEAKVKAEEKKTPAFQGLLHQIGQKGKSPPPKEPFKPQGPKPKGTANLQWELGGADWLKKYFAEMVEYTGAKTLKEAYNKLEGADLTPQAKHIRNVMNGTEKSNSIVGNWAEELADKPAKEITKEPEPTPTPAKPAKTPKYDLLNPPPAGSPDEKPFIEHLMKSLGLSEEKAKEALKMSHQMQQMLPKKAASASPGPSSSPTTIASPRAADFKQKFDAAVKSAQPAKALNTTNMAKMAKFIPSAKPGAWSSAPSAVEYAVRSYTNGSYQNINGALRKPGSQPKEYEEYAENMKKAFEHPLAKNTKDFITYRSFNMPEPLLDQLKESLAKGEDAHFTHEGFVSTTFRKNFAEDWTGGTVLEILVRKETPALSVRDISHHSHEDEVLLNHGQRFRVVEITEAYGVKRVIRVVTA